MEAQMSSSLLIVIVGVAAIGAAASYLTAYGQISHVYAAPEARRRALGAVPGPFAFFGVLAAVLAVAAPLVSRGS
jgi:hypothetical protein